LKVKMLMYKSSIRCIDKIKIDAIKLKKVNLSLPILNFKINVNHKIILATKSLTRYNLILPTKKLNLFMRKVKV